MTKTEKALAEYYYLCKGKKKALEAELMKETARLQARIGDLDELMLEIEVMLGKENIKPIYEHFEKFAEEEKEE